MNKNIDNLEAKTNKNFDKTKERIKKSKNDLIEKIEHARENLKKFVDERVTGAESKLMADINLLRAHVLRQLHVIRTEVGKCSKKDDVKKLEEKLKELSDGMATRFNDTHEKIENAKKEMGQLFKTEIEASEERQNKFIENQIDKFDEKSKNRFKELHNQSSEIQSKLGDINLKICKIDEISQNISEVKKMVEQIADPVKKIGHRRMAATEMRD